jgi:hypothetical protein
MIIMGTAIIVHDGRATREPQGILYPRYSEGIGYNAAAGVKHSGRKQLSTGDSDMHALGYLCVLRLGRLDIHYSTVH